jgi:hypothetical protein
MKRLIVSATAIGLVLCAVAPSAHHSIAGVYDGSRQVTIEGVISRFQFVNPHPFMEVDVADGSGKAEQWTLEMDNRHELVEVGVTSETFKPGDRVVVRGNPAHKPGPRLYIRRLERAVDGLLYEQRQQSPSITRPTRPRK